MWSHREPGFYGFSLLGRGFILKDTRRHPLLYSQRNRGHRFGAWWLSRLRPTISMDLS